MLMQDQVLKEIKKKKQELCIECIFSYLRVIKIYMEIRKHNLIGVRK